MRILVNSSLIKIPLLFARHAGSLFCVGVVSNYVLCYVLRYVGLFMNQLRSLIESLRDYPVCRNFFKRNNVNCA